MLGNDELYEEIIRWGRKSLLSLGYLLKSNLPENVINTPWSYVVRFETSDGYIYLKHTPELFALEPTIIQILKDQFHARVPNFNDNNTLIDDKTQDITIIDLGEIVISHPFFSLLNCLEQIKKHHELTDQDVTYLKIKDACFKNYMNFFASKEHFSEAIAMAQLLHMVYGIVDQYRFMIACGKEKLMSFQHWKLSNLLKKFIALSMFNA